MAKPQRSDPAEAIDIRPATVADLAGVIALDEEVTGLVKPEYWHDMFARYGARGTGSGCFLVAGNPARIDGFIVGEVRAWEFGSPPCGWIFTIAVDPNIRLGGVGSALFESLCGCFRKARVTKIRTMLARDAQLIMSFFRSQGMMAGPFTELEKDLEE